MRVQADKVAGKTEPAGQENSTRTSYRTRELSGGRQITKDLYVNVTAASSARHDGWIEE